MKYLILQNWTDGLHSNGLLIVVSSYYKHVVYLHICEYVDVWDLVYWSELWNRYYQKELVKDREQNVLQTTFYSIYE